jgi:hypothetical protein
MIRTLLTIFTISSLFIASYAKADAGVGAWYEGVTGAAATECTKLQGSGVKRPNICEYRFTTVDINTKALQIFASEVAICFDSDIATVNDSGATVGIYVVNSAATLAGSFKPNHPLATLSHSNQNDCYPLRGPNVTIWLDVETVSSGATAQVIVRSIAR